MKKIFTLIICVFAAFAAFAAENEQRCGSAAYWTLSEDGTLLTITGSGEVTMADEWRTESFTKVVIEEGITSIDPRAFYGLKSIVEVKLPETLAKIDNYAFYNCTNLTTINIPAGVMTVGYWPFNGTKWQANYEGCLVYINDILIYCKAGVSKLDEVNIKEGTRVINTGCFYELKESIPNIIIPQTVNEIGGMQFLNQKIASITLKPLTPPTVYNNTFASMLSDTKLIVNEVALDRYKSTPIWRDFQNYETFSSTGIESISEDDAPVAIYGIDGIKRESLQQGINIVKMRSGNTVKTIVR